MLRNVFPSVLIGLAEQSNKMMSFVVFPGKDVTPGDGYQLLRYGLVLAELALLPLINKGWIRDRYNLNQEERSEGVRPNQVAAMGIVPSSLTHLICTPCTCWHHNLSPNKVNYYIVFNRVL